MYLIRAAPNGSCLFICLRLALEYHKILSATEGPASAVVDGYSPIILKSAEDLRNIIVKWYSGPFAKKTIPSFGPFTEKDGREWIREDILLAETADANGSNEDRTKAYLAKIAMPYKWGGTPEYTAFAFMSKLKVEVYQRAELSSDLVLVNAVDIPNSLGTTKLLYSGRNHYNLLLDDQEAQSLLKKWPDSKLIPFAYGIQRKQ